MLEDVDSIGISVEREGKEEGDKEGDKEGEKKKITAVTLSGLLNCIGKFGLQNHGSFAVSRDWLTWILRWCWIQRGQVSSVANKNPTTASLFNSRLTVSPESSS